MGTFLQLSRRDVVGLGLAVAVVAGCDGARAQPAPGRLAGVVTVPADWRAQPAIAAAATSVMGGGEAAAWGEPGLGCFAVVVTARADQQNPEDALEELRLTLGQALGLDGWMAANPADVRGHIARAGMQGELRGAVEEAPPKGAAVTIATCFYNQRDPDACRVQCRGVLDSLDTSKVKP